MLRFVLRGPLACFSRPESPDRFTYPIPTPSALVDIVSAIYGHPGVGADIRAIHVLAPIQYVQVGHVHVGAVATPDRNTGRLRLRDVEGRPTVETLLRDPAWMIDFEWRQEPNLGKWDVDPPDRIDLEKLDSIFCRRVQTGQFYRTPSLGLHQLRAIFHAPTGKERPIPQSRDFGMVLHGIDYQHDPPIPHVFHAVMHKGVVKVPSFHDRIYRGKKAA